MKWIESYLGPYYNLQCIQSLYPEINRYKYLVRIKIKASLPYKTSRIILANVDCDKGIDAQLKAELLILYILSVNTGVVTQDAIHSWVQENGSSKG